MLRVRMLARYAPKETAFHTIGSSHLAELSRCNTCAMSVLPLQANLSKTLTASTIVMRMKRDADTLPVTNVVAEVLHQIRINIRR